MILDRDPRHHVQEQKVFESGDRESFDRIRFAVEVLRALDLPRTTVAVYPRKHVLSVDRGKDLARGEGATWALIGIPPHATRRHIVHALAELAGIDEVPFAVETLLGQATSIS